MTAGNEHMRLCPVYIDEPDVDGSVDRTVVRWTRTGLAAMRVRGTTAEARQAFAVLMQTGDLLGLLYDVDRLDGSVSRLGLLMAEFCHRPAGDCAFVRYE